MGSGGLAFIASASQGKGKADGLDLSWTPTHVEAGDTLTLRAGGDTAIRGALAQGERVVADIGGRLDIESLQDTSTCDSRQRNAGFSISVPIGPGTVGGSISAGNSRIDSDYASVTTRSGIEAGDKGFDVRVGGDTTLTGAVIASTQAAVDNDKNHFTTGGSLTLTDLENKADYDAQGASINIGTSLSTDGQLKPQGTSAGFGEDSDSAHSITTAGISATAGDSTVRTGDAPTGIAPIFDADKVQKEIDAQVRITQTFSQQAHQAVSSYMQEARKALRQQLNQIETDADRAALQARLDELLLEERVMNVLIGAVTGMGGSALSKETLSAAADEMRKIMIEDSKKFPGVVDAYGNVLDNISGPSEGIRGDGVKLGGTRVDLDLLCRADNGRCAIQMNDDGIPILDSHGKTQLALIDGKVKFLGSFDEFLRTPDGQRMIGPTGGIQGLQGKLFGIPYQVGSWQDKLIEAFAGTHDYIGGSLSGLYDEQGASTRGRSPAEVILHDRWSEIAIPIAAPFAAAEALPPELWQAISIFLREAR